MPFLSGSLAALLLLFLFGMQIPKATSKGGRWGLVFLTLGTLLVNLYGGVWLVPDPDMWLAMIGMTLIMVASIVMAVKTRKIVYWLAVCLALMAAIYYWWVALDWEDALSIPFGVALMATLVVAVVWMVTTTKARKVAEVAANTAPVPASTTAQQNAGQPVAASPNQSAPTVAQPASQATTQHPTAPRQPVDVCWDPVMQTWWSLSRQMYWNDATQTWLSPAPPAQSPAPSSQTPTPSTGQQPAATGAQSPPASN